MLLLLILLLLCLVLLLHVRRMMHNLVMHSMLGLHVGHMRLYKSLLHGRIRIVGVVGGWEDITGRQERLVQREVADVVSAADTDRSNILISDVADIWRKILLAGVTWVCVAACYDVTVEDRRETILAEHNLRRLNAVWHKLVNQFLVLLQLMFRNEHDIAFCAFISIVLVHSGRLNVLVLQAFRIVKRIWWV